MLSGRRRWRAGIHEPPQRQREAYDERKDGIGDSCTRSISSIRPNGRNATMQFYHAAYCECKWEPGRGELVDWWLSRRSVSSGLVAGESHNMEYYLTIYFILGMAACILLFAYQITAAFGGFRCLLPYCALLCRSSTQRHPVKS